MRTMTITLGGKEYTLAANFKAALEIAETVGDPLRIAREAVVESTFLAANIPYDPKFEFTIKNLPQIIYIGAKHVKGQEVSLAAIQEAVFEEGFIPVRVMASKYLAKLVANGPTVKTGEEDSSPGE